MSRQPADPYRSFKWKLFGIHIGALLAVWLTLLLIVYALMANDLYRLLDGQLRLSATRIIQHYSHSRSPLPLPIGVDSRQTSYSLWSVTRRGARWAAEYVDGNPFVDVVYMYKQALANTAGSFGSLTVEGVRYRAFYALVPTHAGTYLIRALHNTSQIQSTLGHLLWTLGIAGTAALALTVAVGIWLTQRSVQPMIASWERQRQFVADASHELRTPLAIIKTNLDIMLRNPEHTISEEMHFLGNAYAEVGRTADLIEKLLTLARADSQEQLIEKNPVDLSALAQEVVDSLKPLADAAEKNLYTVTPQFPCAIRGDAARLRQLLLILVDNALKYTEPGAQITVSVECDTLQSTLRVVDTGVGIEAGLLPHVFERFIRSDKSRRRSGGSGLGLAIAKWIVDAHGGEIQVTSALGKGTAFTVTLPN